MTSSVSFLPPPLLKPGTSAKARAAAGAANQDDGTGTSFGDLLPDNSGGGSPKTADNAAALKAKAARDDADGAAPSMVGGATPPPPTDPAPILAASCYQVSLAAPPPPDKTADAGTSVEETLTATAGGLTAMAPAALDPQAKPPLIRPHGPPVGSPGNGDADLTADATSNVLPQAKPGLILPHSPPVTDPGDGDGAAPGSVMRVPDPSTLARVGDPGTKSPPILPPCPPDVQPVTPTATTAPATVAADGAPGIIKAAPSPIDPHGPPPDPGSDGTATQTAAVAAFTPVPDALTRPPLIAPHGPPSSGQLVTAASPLADTGISDPADGIVKGVATAIDAYGLPVVPSSGTDKGAASPIDPHGLPPALPDDQPAPGPGAVSGSQTFKWEYTTTLPTLPDPTAAPGGVKGMYTTTIPAPPTSLPDPTSPAPATDGALQNNATPFHAAQAASAPLFQAGASVPITTSAQVATATARPAPTDADAAETAPVAAAGSANVAAQTVLPDSRMISRQAVNSAQVAHNVPVTHSDNPVGTGAAKGGVNVNASASNPATTVDRDTLLKRGAAVTSAAGVAGRAGTNSRGAGASNLTPVPAAVAATPGSPDLRADSTPAASPAPGVVQVDRMETLFQSVTEAGQSLAPGSHGQLELKVRLNGGADDVTVRVQMNSDQRPQVTFHTNTPELQQALERGWNDFTASTPQNAQPATADAARFAPATNGNAASTSDFTSGQQNSRRQDAPDASGTAPGAWRGSRIAAATASGTTAKPGTPGRSGGWSGWA